MKHIISDHALALGTPFMYELNGVETEMQMYECGNTALLFAVDCAWLDDQEDGTLAIPSFVDEGNAIVLVDNEDEIDLNLKTVGTENDKTLVDAILFRIKRDIEEGDYTKLKELLHFLPEECLKNYK